MRPATWRGRECKCPDCGKLIDSASDILNEVSEQRPPREGDFSVCLRCGMVHAYNSDGTLRRLDIFEALEAARDPDVIEARNKVLTYNRSKQ